MPVKQSKSQVSGLPETVQLLTMIEAKIAAKQIAPLSPLDIGRLDDGTTDMMLLYHLSKDDAGAIALFAVMVGLPAIDFVDKCKRIITRCAYQEAFESTALDEFGKLNSPLGYFARLEMENRYAAVVGITPGDFLRGAWWFLRRFFGELWRRVRDDTTIQEALKECREALMKLFRRVGEIIWDTLRGGPSSGPSPA